MEKHLIKQIYKTLAEIGEGDYFCGESGFWPFRSNWGWINIDKCKDGTFAVLWCSDRDTHNPLVGSAFSVSFSDNAIDFVCKSALSMWPVRDKKDQEYYAQQILFKLNRALRQMGQEEIF